MTLVRTLEPEVMDSMEEATDYDSMDHSEVNRLFVDDLLADLDSTGDPRQPNAEVGASDDDEREQLDILDLGTGTAQIPIQLCRRHPDCRVMAVDMATSMLDLARYNIEIAGLIQRIFLRQMDAKAIPFPGQTFAVVMSNSIVHHIPDPAIVLAEAVRVTRPGGLIFFRDLARPSNEAEVEMLVAKYAAGANDRQRTLFANSLRAALNLADIQKLVEAMGFDATTVRMTSDRHWTWSVRAVTPGMRARV